MNGTEEERIVRLETEHRFDREAYIKESTEIKQNLVYIKETLEEIRENQSVFAKCVTDINLDLAKRPPVDEIKKCMDDVKVHKTYFAIFGSALVLAWGLLLLIGGKLWKGS